MQVKALMARIRRFLIQHRVFQKPFWLRARWAIVRGHVIRGATTVVIVNWNSWPYLRIALDAVRHFSDGTVSMIVVDNASTDESRSKLGHCNDIRLVQLPRNLGHGPALDIGFLLARTEFVVSLDVDAFPIGPKWIELLIAPLRSGMVVSGAHVRGGFIHPCCLAMRFEDFVRRRHSFTPRYTARLPENADQTDSSSWDVGQRISLQESRRFPYERSGALGPGDIGSYWDGLIYHNFYSTRFGSNLPPAQEEIEHGVSPQRAAEAWTWAVSNLFGSD